MSTDRRTDKEDTTHISSGKLLCHEGAKRCHLQRCGWTIEPVIQTEIKSEREKQVSWIKAYLQNLEKWCRGAYLQSRNRNAGVENKCKETKEARGGGMNWETWIDIYTLQCIK